LLSIDTGVLEAMKKIQWNTDKNEKLKQERGISFERIIDCIENGQVLDDIDHPNQEKYGHQNMFVINVDDYVYLVPYVENEQEIFLKTIIPSRKATKKYLGGKK
jgi:uncharacterized DUF497 family protein